MIIITMMNRPYIIIDFNVSLYIDLSYFQIIPMTINSTNIIFYVLRCTQLLTTAYLVHFFQIFLIFLDLFIQTSRIQLLANTLFLLSIQPLFTSFQLLHHPYLIFLIILLLTNLTSLQLVRNMVCNLLVLAVNLLVFDSNLFIQPVNIHLLSFIEFLDIQPLLVQFLNCTQ